MKTISKYLFVFFLSLLGAISNQLSGQNGSKTISTTDYNKKISRFQYNNPDSGIILSNILCDYYKAKNNLDSFYIVQINMANCYNVQQKNNQALSLYDECSKYFIKKNDSIRLYFIYSGIGGIYYNITEDKKAHYYFRLANEVCNSKKFPEWKFTGILNICDYFLKTNQPDSVLKYYQQAASLLDKIKNKYSYNRLKLEYASLYYLKKQYLLAIENAKEALNFHKQYDKQFTMRSFDIIAMCYLARKDFAQTKLYLDSALIVAKKMNSKKDYYDLLGDVYKYDTTIKDYKSANNDLLEMASLKDSLFAINKINFTNDLLFKYETEKREAEKKILEIENSRRNDVINWQRILIVLIIAIFLIIILGLVLYLKHRSKQQKKAIEKEKIAAELKALKAQLNPHFIQNIFQIISNQVRINPSEVEVFLQKTASYFRSVLNGTDKSVQSLEDEIIFTEKYLQFQQSLFKNKLTYSINIADDVDSFGILVPAMLLQPFIENSVKYGLQLSQKEMHIDINCFSDNQYLHILIIDTGNFIVNETIINDKSFGIALITKRLHLFYKTYGSKPKLEANRIDGNSGFKVEISLPL